MQNITSGLVIQAVCRAYNMPLEAIQKPKSKRGNLIGTHLSSDARITLGYLLLESAKMPLREVCDLLKYAYNHRRSYDLRQYHKRYCEADPAYRGRFEKARGLLTEAANSRQSPAAAQG